MRNDKTIRIDTSCLPGARQTQAQAVEDICQKTKALLLSDGKGKKAATVFYGEANEKAVEVTAVSCGDGMMNLDIVKNIAVSLIQQLSNNEEHKQAFLVCDWMIALAEQLMPETIMKKIRDPLGRIIEAVVLTNERSEDQ